MPSAPKQGAHGKASKLLTLIDCRLNVTLNDRRNLIGTFLAFDKHLNLVLSDTEEVRSITTPSPPGLPSTKVEKKLRRSLGLVILRGENVVCVTVEGPKPPKPTKRVATGGPGGATGMGRGQPTMGGPQQGLGAGGVYGVGGGGMGRGR
ncbi:hypothetical protein TrCOL_g13432 [Triparma columacea]|uniref:Sm protein B n=1 Tax=Triparma columacea TaxID=722753 RepID=A0A9W7GDD8_9STRA|nr:hypothetical protein TrCOL_g13432 [Triparma columacea]